MHPNGELIREGFEAFANGDLDTLSRLFDDDIKWHAMGTSDLSGEYEGKGEVFAFFGRLLQMTEGTYHQDVHAILADDDHVVVLTDYGQDKPKPFSGQQVFVWHVRDGKAAECWGIPNDQAAAAAAIG
jgi:ketosteroid isomerase-like protein